MISVDDKDLYQLLISEFRYAVRRDNHLAPSTCVHLVKRYLPLMEKSYRARTAYQLTEEIIFERLYASDYLNPDFNFEVSSLMFFSNQQLKEDSTWESLLLFLTDYLESMPYNSVEGYMKYIRGRMTYSDGIDYYSAEIQNKIADNINKK